MPERRVLSTTVIETIWLTPSMVRVVVDGPDLRDLPAGEFTDEYVKCRFGDKTRSYTIRDWDPGARSHYRTAGAVSQWVGAEDVHSQGVSLKVRPESAL